MASQMGYIGRIGKVIHYKMGDKYYSRSAPRKFTQTKATKASAKLFGRASGISAKIRAGLDSVIPNSSDRKMHARLVAEVFAWLQVAADQPADESNQPKFDPANSLNTKAVSLESRWRQFPVRVVNPSTGLLEIKIPAFVPGKSFIAPAGAVEVICRIAIAVTDITKITSVGQYSTEIIYSLDDLEVSEQTIAVELPMPDGSLVVTGLALQYAEDKYFRKKIITDNSFLPSRIISAMYL
jgi:hypothetical protein